MSTLTFTAHITVGGEVLRPEVTVTVTPPVQVVSDKRLGKKRGLR